MSFPRFELQKTAAPPATLATTATNPVSNPSSVATVAFVAGGTPKTAFLEQSAPPHEIDLPAFAERAAIREHDGGMSRAEADEAAAREMGFHTAQALHLAAIASWRAPIIAAPKTDLHGFDKLAAVSLTFLGSDWALKALATGWDEIALFAVHEASAPRERLDAWGLLPLLAWGVHRCKVESFGRNACTLRTEGGGKLRQHRHRANFDRALCWWLHPTLSQGERPCAA